jgi:transcription initiation factor TFIIF subunit beta
MPENELLDRLFVCFRRYKYWSMKALKAELQQPEAYLRDVLDKIAVLAKTGTFATQWSLKPENMPKDYAGAEEGAPDAGEDSDMADVDDDDDDLDMKFEDVA